MADLTCDIKKEVKAAAVTCMTAMTNYTGNRDLEQFLPAVIDAAQSTANTSNVRRQAGWLHFRTECGALAAIAIETSIAW